MPDLLYFAGRYKNVMQSATAPCTTDLLDGHLAAANVHSEDQSCKEKIAQVRGRVQNASVGLC